MRLKSAPGSERAAAKINLTLEVTGKRDDGYHEIASVMQAVDLCDTLTFEPSQRLCLTCDVPEMLSPDNLVVRAIRLLQERAGGQPGASVCLDKRIPLAGGLGGGSSDAAVTLQAVNEMWDLKLGPDDLRGIAARLGSDVPFFLCDGATALVTGRGEKVSPIPGPAGTWLVLLKPPLNMANKTRRMYSGLDPSLYTDGEHTRRLVDLMKRGERVDSRFCYNVFDDIACSLLPTLEHYRVRFLAAGASQIHLAGSGPTLYTVAGDRAEGEDMCNRLKEERLEAYLVRTL